MWNTTPDAELLRAAESGELNTSAGLAKQVDRLMASPRLDAGMRAFFDDMLQLDTFDTVSKDSLLYPKWGSGMATSAREETLRTVIGLALHDNGDIRDLMTTRQTYIDRRLAVLYRVPFPFTGDWVKYEFPAGFRPQRRSDANQHAGDVLPPRPFLAHQARCGADGYLPLLAHARRRRTTSIFRWSTIPTAHSKPCASG